MRPAVVVGTVAGAGLLGLIAFSERAKASEADAESVGPAPPSPTPRPAPGTPPKPLKNVLAAQLAQSLLETQRKAGSVKAAKGREDRELVRRFQDAAKIGIDGKAGPATLLQVARAGTGILPLVMYWPRGATTTNVTVYRAALRALALKASQQDRNELAAQLKASADRERGQGGVAGASARGASRAPAPAGTPSSTDEATVAKREALLRHGDPYPNDPDLYVGQPRNATRIAATKRWQALANGLHRLAPLKVDGEYGSKTEATTRKVQTLINGLYLSAGIPAIRVDGKAGPKTRTGTVRLANEEEA